jgi:hypothetical protein
MISLVKPNKAWLIISQLAPWREGVNYHIMEIHIQKEKQQQPAVLLVTT